MNQIVNMLFDKVIALELDIADIPAKFKNDVIIKLADVGFLNEDNISDIKDAKIEEMSNTCSNVITNGFDVKLSDGEVHHYSLTTQDQLNLITLSTMAAAGENDIPYHADGELCKYYSAEDIGIITYAATSHKTYHVTYFNSLKAYIASLENIADILNITYGVDIPADYQSDILKQLINGISG